MSRCNFNVGCPYISFDSISHWTWNMDRNKTFFCICSLQVFSVMGSDKLMIQVSWRYAYYFPTVSVSHCCDGVLVWCFRIAFEVNEGVRCWLSDLRSCGIEQLWNGMLQWSCSYFRNHLEIGGQEWSCRPHSYKSCVMSSRLPANWLSVYSCHWTGLIMPLHVWVWHRSVKPSAMAAFINSII